MGIPRASTASAARSACRSGSRGPSTREALLLRPGIQQEERLVLGDRTALHPQIQEFQALGLAYILLKRGERDDALRVYRDNVELLETRFRDDYTDPDPLLAETLWMFATLADASDDPNAAGMLRARAASWAPGSVWAK